MKQLIFLLLLMVLIFAATSCGNLRPIRVKVINPDTGRRNMVEMGKNTGTRQSCVMEFIYREVKPLEANRICSDIYKNR